MHAKRLLLVLLLCTLASFRSVNKSPKGHTFQRSYQGAADNGKIQTFLKFYDSTFTVVNYVDTSGTRVKQTLGGKWHQVEDTIYLSYPERTDTAAINIVKVEGLPTYLEIFMNFNHYYFQIR